MYRKASSSPTPPDSFELPFERKLSQDNRWVIMANLIPWDEFEEEYAKNFLNANLVNQINERMVKKVQEGTEEESKKKAASSVLSMLNL